jgi:hypothetical protein
MYVCMSQRLRGMRAMASPAAGAAACDARAGDRADDPVTATQGLMDTAPRHQTHLEPSFLENYGHGTL